MRWGSPLSPWLAAALALASGCMLPPSPVLVDAAPETMDAADASDAGAERDASTRDADAGDSGENEQASWEESSDCEQPAYVDERDACYDGGSRDAAIDASIDMSTDGRNDGSSDSSDGATDTEGDSGDGSADAGACVQAIAAGMWHTCVLTRRGNVHCWGYDVHGELGDGTTMSTARPTLSPVPAMTGAKAVVGGGYFTCGLTTGNGVRCWGDDRVGQLGVALPDASVPQPLAPTMDILGNVRAIAAGYDIACALTETTGDGSGVRCWGNNANGQLGLGTASPSIQLTPPSADVLTGVKSLATGLGRHVCALMTSGGVRCWGENNHGQLGMGSASTTSVLSPPAADVLEQATAVAVGFYHTCAAMAGGGIRCWGSNDHGQLGDGTTADRAAAASSTTLFAGTPIKAIAAGYLHTCALTAAGAVYCWGDDQDGQIGDGQLTAELRLAPGPAVPIAAPVTALVTQESANCVLTADGDVQCWGANYYGQLGDGTTATYGRATPASVLGLPSLCP